MSPRTKSSLRIAVIGAGNGGQAMAAHLSRLGYAVNLYDRNVETVGQLRHAPGIRLIGKLRGVGRPQLVTQNLAEAVRDAHIVMVVTTADAHAQIAEQLTPVLTDGQIVVLNPGRTGGAIEFHNVLLRSCKRCVHIAEAQSLVYVCRIVRPGTVRINGVKSRVGLASLPPSDASHICSLLNEMYPCFYPAANVLITSFDNIGAIIHPALTLFNVANIETGRHSHFYGDVTGRMAGFLEQLDSERLEIGRAYKVDLISVRDWMAAAYPDTVGVTLYERMSTNRAYSAIVAPNTLVTRYLYEDLATGLVPLVSFAEVAGVRTPLMRAIVDLGGALLNRDFWREGRTLEAMGLANMDQAKILEHVQIGHCLSDDC